MQHDVSSRIISLHRPFFLKEWIRDARNLYRVPRFNTKKELLAYIACLHRWINTVVPPPCQRVDAGPDAIYSPIYHNIGDLEDEENLAKWRKLCNGGPNGFFLVLLCLYVWKADGTRMFGTEKTYNRTLLDVVWILEQCNTMHTLPTPEASPKTTPKKMKSASANSSTPPSKRRNTGRRA